MGILGLAKTAVVGGVLSQCFNEKSFGPLGKVFGALYDTIIKPIWNLFTSAASSATSGTTPTPSSTDPAP